MPVADAVTATVRWARCSSSRLLSAAPATMIGVTGAMLSRACSPTSRAATATWVLTPDGRTKSAIGASAAVPDSPSLAVVPIGKVAAT